MHVTSFPQQVGWLGGRSIDLHPWGSWINLDEWHGLWSTVKYWLNIP
jgi:hypothetical protein